MKKIFSALFFTLFGAAALMTSCSDVPAPYEIKSPDDVDLVGTGTKEDPYNVATAQMKQDGSVAWVQGYIVGVMETNVDPFTANFAAPFSTSSNLMIADNPDEEKSKNCLMVQLPTGDIRTALNLVDHADNLKQPVILQGTLTSYFSAAGLKDVSAGVFKGEEIGGEQEVDGAYINESFKTDLGVFTSYSVEGSLKWENDYSSAMIKGGSATGKFPSDTWLVAKSVDLSKEDKAYITFDHAINYASGATLSDYHKLVISKDYDGSGVAGIKNAQWEEIAVKMPSGSSFDFVNTGKVAVPAEYFGQGKVTVALHYISTSEVGTTWEVQNFVMAHGDAEEVPEPGTPEAENTKDTAYDVTKALTLTENNGTKIAWVKGYIVGGVSSDNSASQVDGPEDVVFGTESVRNSAILIAASKEETDYTKCMVIGFGSDSPEAKTALNLVDHPENLGKEVVLCGTLKYAFSAPGMKTITEFELKNGGTEPEPGTGDNLLANSSFETWTGETPDSWGRASVTSATYAQNADAQDGTYSVLMKGSSSNARFGSEDITLSAGTYTLSVYAKSVADPAKFKMGWVPIEGGNPNTNKYNYILDSTDLSNEWQEYSAEFTLDAETVVSIFFVNSKSGSGKDLLIDKVSLIKK